MATMKAIFVIVALFGLSVGVLRADTPSFIIVTVETVFADGVTDPVGEVELVVGETAASYLVMNGNRKYELPKSRARKIAAEEAAVALLAQRARMYSQLTAPRASAAAARPPRPSDDDFYNQQLIKQRQPR